MNIGVANPIFRYLTSHFFSIINKNTNKLIIYIRLSVWLYGKLSNKEELDVMKKIALVSLCIVSFALLVKSILSTSTDYGTDEYFIEEDRTNDQF